jgi:hypothetical protein
MDASTIHGHDSSAALVESSSSRQRHIHPFFSSSHRHRQRIVLCARHTLNSIIVLWAYHTIPQRKGEALSPLPWPVSSPFVFGVLCFHHPGTLEPPFSFCGPIMFSAWGRKSAQGGGT